MDWSKVNLDSPEEVQSLAKMLADPECKTKYPELWAGFQQAGAQLADRPHLVIDLDSDPEQIKREMKMFEAEE